MTRATDQLFFLRDAKPCAKCGGKLVLEKMPTDYQPGSTRCTSCPFGFEVAPKRKRTRR